jgi:hypothetical protein
MRWTLAKVYTKLIESYKRMTVPSVLRAVSEIKDFGFGSEIDQMGAAVQYHVG